MAINTTRWSPDTCACVLEYTWDSTTSENTRVHTPSNVVNTCVFHQILGGLASIFNSVIDENSRKNNFAALALTTLATLTNTTTNPDGSVTVTWKAGVSVTLSLSGVAPNRVLNAVTTGLSANQRSQLQTAADTRFGVGKILVT